MTRIAGLTGIGIALILAAACGGNPETLGAPAAPPASAPGDRSIPVRTMAIEPTTFRETIEVSGTLEPWLELSLASELGGLVNEVGFDKGDIVEPDTVLARIGDDLAQVRLEQAQADLMAAEANFTKVSRLAEREAVPKQDLVAATARRDRIDATVRELELRLERSILRATIRGTVVDRNLDPGEVLAPGSLVATIQQLDRLKVVASVPDTEIAWLAVGGRAVVSVDAWPGRTFDASVRFVSPAADRSSRTFEVELELPNRRMELRPGMVVRVELVRRKIDDGVAVPLDALVASVDGTIAFVVEDCRARVRRLSLGGSEGDRILVRDGLLAGDLLVIEGQRDLADGQRVASESCR